MSKPTVDTVEEVQPYLRDHEERINTLEHLCKAYAQELVWQQERLDKLEKPAPPEPSDSFGQRAAAMLALLAKPNESAMDVLLRVLDEREQLLAKAAR